MKYLFTTTCLIAILFTWGCKKDNSTNTKTPPTQPTPKLGQLVKVNLSAAGFYTFSLTEYAAADRSTVFHKDTTIFVAPYTFQYHPYIGNTVHVEVGWRVINTQFTPNIHFFYNGVEYSDYTTGTADINPPFDWYKSMNFVVK